MSSNGLPQPSAAPPGSSETEPIRTPHGLDDGELELAVVLAVLRTLTAWESFGEGSERLLRGAGRRTRTDPRRCGCREASRSIARAIWSMPGVDGAALQHALGSWRVPRGAGLAGRAWELGEAVDHPACDRADDAAGQQRPPQETQCDRRLPVREVRRGAGGRRAVLERAA